jgi:hypothetical protein
MAAGVVLLRQPGPKKVEPFAMDMLKNDINDLKHRRKRSLGADRLYRQYAPHVSRRELQQMVTEVRVACKRDQKQALKRIQWLAPGVVWSMDDTEFGRDENGEKMNLHMLQDLASQYKFRPMAGDFPDGEAVGGHLENQISLYGAPLFLKMDNGGNLNHSAVKDVLRDHFILPLNSPPNYAPYNGGIEHCQGEIKPKIREKLSPFDTCPRDHFHAYAEAGAHDLNHKIRRSLKGRHSCQVFFEQKDKYRFNRRERRAVYEWLIDKKYYILSKMDAKDENKKAKQTAWRIAVETWLRKKGYIFIPKKPEVLPYFSGKNYHN